MGFKDALNFIKVNLGFIYNKSSHNFNYNNNIKEGELKQISKNEFVGMSKGKPIYCFKNSKGKMKCKKIPPKLLKR